MSVSRKTLCFLYGLFGLLIAISVTFPLFLINRERVLAARDRSAAAGAQPYCWRSP